MPCYSPKYCYYVHKDDGSASELVFKHPSAFHDKNYPELLKHTVARWRATGELEKLDVDSRYTPVLLPCNACFGCKRTKAAQYGARSVHEMSIHDVPACMLTLTFEDAPFSLEHRTFQLFAKNFRYHFKNKIRMLMCGEYGDQSGRAHFHAIVFGEDFSGDRRLFKNTPSGKLYNSSSLSMLWPHGWSTVNNVSLASAMYVGGYCYKKLNTAQGEPDRTYYRDGRRKEYIISSHSPALGVDWIKHYADTVFDRDGFLVMKSGVKMPIPRAYKEWCRIHRPELHMRYIARMRQIIGDGAFDFISDLEDQDSVQYTVEYNALVHGIETEYIKTKRKTCQHIAEQKFARKSQL